MHINVKHMSNDKKNTSIHVFNMIATADDVSASHLPDYHMKSMSDVKVADILPSRSNVSQLKTDLIPLWSRVMVSYLKEFSMFKDVIVWHIPHEYSEIMQQPSKEVCVSIGLTH